MGGWRGLLEWLGVFWPGTATRRACITLADAAITAITLSEALVTDITLADAVVATVTISDAQCEAS